MAESGNYNRISNQLSKANIAVLDLIIGAQLGAGGIDLILDGPLAGGMAGRSNDVANHSLLTSFTSIGGVTLTLTGRSGDNAFFSVDGVNDNLSGVADERNIHLAATAAQLAAVRLTTLSQLSGEFSVAAEFLSDKGHGEKLTGLGADSLTGSKENQIIILDLNRAGAQQIRGGVRNVLKRIGIEVQGKTQEVNASVFLYTNLHRNFFALVYNQRRSGNGSGGLCHHSHLQNFCVFSAGGNRRH